MKIHELFSSILLIIVLPGAYTHDSAIQNGECEDASVTISAPSDENCDENDINCKEFYFDAENLGDLEREVSAYVESQLINDVNGVTTEATDNSIAKTPAIPTSTSIVTTESYYNKSQGTVVLGQDQDEKLGGFQAKDSFRGVIKNCMLWNRTLTPGEIKDMQDECNCPKDYIMSATKNDHIYGNVTSEFSDTC
uniref:female protein-like n=1 Tax=Styela clava TaxID=7725 RepID=UPI0019395C06|nr:female protein-like [Styela clava]